MPKNRKPPREVVKENLRALLNAYDMTAPEVAKKAGVDRKSITNMLNGIYDPRPDKVHAVAQVFGLTGWQLLRQNLHSETIAHTSAADDLLDLFYEATPEQRETILKVAAMTSKKNSK